MLNSLQLYVFLHKCPWIKKRTSLGSAWAPNRRLGRSQKNNRSKRSTPTPHRLPHFRIASSAPAMTVTICWSWAPPQVPSHRTRSPSQASRPRPPTALRGRWPTFRASRSGPPPALHGRVLCLEAASSSCSAWLHQRPPSWRFCAPSPRTKLRPRCLSSLVRVLIGS